MMAQATPDTSTAEAPAIGPAGLHYEPLAFDRCMLRHADSKVRCHLVQVAGGRFEVAGLQACERQGNVVADPKSGACCK
jgi:hypothetical protein